MRVTAEINEQTYEHVKRRALSRSISMGKLLGEMIADALKAKPLGLVKSGRFNVIAAPAGTKPVSIATIQELIDQDGVL